jgi:hypothetical protein
MKMKDELLHFNTAHSNLAQAWLRLQKLMECQQGLLKHIVAVSHSLLEN